MPSNIPARPAGERKTRRAIVHLLKTEGALDSTRLAKRLRLTPMAVRQHLYALQREKLVTAEERPVPLGRPAKHWQLTPGADRLFADAHAALSLDLIGAVTKVFGSSGLKRVLEARSALQRARYGETIPASASMEDKLRELARARTEEGWMAEVRRDDDGFLFIERHCPIHVAAKAHPNLGSMELDLFRSVLGPGVEIEQLEQLIAGNRRSVYRVAPSTGVNRSTSAALH
jgi:predicted ArsR family transcriptional regulator